MTRTPAAQMRINPTRVGETWDAVRVRAAVGAQVMDRLGAICGSVVTDNLQSWFFVQQGAGRKFVDVPAVTVCLPGSHILIPADDVTSPPGPHWCRVGARRCTRSGMLLRAIEEAET